jgi:hypothetical protein
LSSTNFWALVEQRAADTPNALFSAASAISSKRSLSSVPTVWKVRGSSVHPATCATAPKRAASASRFFMLHRSPNRFLRGQARGVLDEPLAERVVDLDPEHAARYRVGKEGEDRHTHQRQGSEHRIQVGTQSRFGHLAP